MSLLLYKKYKRALQACIISCVYVLHKEFQNIKINNTIYILKISQNICIYHTFYMYFDSYFMAKLDLFLQITNEDLTIDFPLQKKAW